jgi:iron complex transport system ATP-binding protein
VTVRVGGATLLDGVSLAVEPGEVVAVAGPNGAGKTTLVRALAGDVRPAGGSVELDDRALDDWNSGELALRRAVMSTDGTVAFDYTAAEVALLGRMPFHGGNPTVGDRAVVTDLLEAVDCSRLADRVFATLSSGERQRVGLARAIAQVSDVDPETDPPAGDRFLLLDEPTSSLDPAHQHVAMRLVRDQAAAGHGVLAVLHDLNLAAAYADRVALMKEARIVEVGTPGEVLRADLLESVFDIPVLVMPHPYFSHPLVIAEPHADGT